MIGGTAEDSPQYESSLNQRKLNRFQTERNEFGFGEKGMHMK